MAAQVETPVPYQDHHKALYQLRKDMSIEAALARVRGFQEAVNVYRPVELPEPQSDFPINVGPVWKKWSVSHSLIQPAFQT